MNQEYIDVVDENNNVIGKATRKEMRERKPLHRGTAIFVFNSKGEIYVHKRTKTKDIYPGYYDIAFGGCVSSGESHYKSALRELQEEAEISGIELEFLFNFRVKTEIDNSFTKVYKCIYDGKLILQKEEVETGTFMSIEEMKELTKKKRFRPDTLAIFKKLEKYYKNF